MTNKSRLIHEAYMIAQLRQKPENLLTESEFEMVLENRIENVKKANPTLDTSHDPHAEHKDSGAIVDHFADKADPTRNKAHTQWIVGQYKKKNIKQEDFPRVHKALSDFEQYKPKLENKDINKYSKVSDVEDAVAPHVGTHATKAAETKAVKTEGADKVYEDDHITVHHIKTEAAAKAYGKGSKWCTSGDENNMFDTYHKDGPIHVITMKNEKQENGHPRKFQAHPASGQFMNEKNNPISDEDFNKIKPHYHKFMDAHPKFFD